MNQLLRSIVLYISIYFILDSLFRMLLMAALWLYDVHSIHVIGVRMLLYT